MENFVFIIAFTLILGFGSLYFVESGGADAIKYLQGISSLSVALSLAVAILTYFDKRKLDINNRTFDLMDKFDSKDMREARKLSKEIDKILKELSPVGLLDKINYSPDLDEPITLLFNYFTKVKYAIESEIVNKDVIETSAHSNHLI